MERVAIEPRWPTLSRGGRLLAILAVPWFFGTAFGASALGLVGRDDPAALRWLVVIVALAPIIVTALHPWLGRVPGLRWIHHRTQPRLVIEAAGLDLRLPEVGERLYDWAEVGAIRMRRDRGADLLTPDGIPLAKIPESMVFAGGNRWRRESIASVIVRAKPDRYQLSGANWAGVPNEFGLRMPAAPLVDSDRWAPRRRIVSVGVGAALLGVTGLLFLRYLTS